MWNISWTWTVPQSLDWLRLRVGHGVDCENYLSTRNGNTRPGVPRTSTDVYHDEMNSGNVSVTVILVYWCEIMSQRGIWWVLHHTLDTQTPVHWLTHFSDISDISDLCLKKKLFTIKLIIVMINVSDWTIESSYWINSHIFSFLHNSLTLVMTTLERWF